MWRRVFPCVLVLCLMLNGIGSAMASVSMHLAPEAVSPQPVATLEQCDQASSHAGTAAAHDAAQPIVDTSHAMQHGDDCSGDCCDGSTGCQCLCAHHVQAFTPPMPVFADAPAHDRLAMGVTPGHASPPPGENIRPPIV